MYELTIESVFSAAHAIVIAGQREPIHGHDWHVTACIAGPNLDADGLLVDFHAVEAALHAILLPFRNANLNDTPPFNRTNPTAENVAAYIASSLDARLPRPQLDNPPRVAWVRVTEAHGCAATYRVQ